MQVRRLEPLILRDLVGNGISWPLPSSNQEPLYSHPYFFFLLRFLSANICRLLSLKRNKPIPHPFTLRHRKPHIPESKKIPTNF